MQGSSHALIGVTLGFALGLHAHEPLTSAAILAGIAGVAALVPDLDHAGSALGRDLSPVSWVVRAITRHRGFTHSLAALALGAIAFLKIPSGSIPPLMAIAALIGYASHIAADMTTRNGVQLLWPLNYKLHLLPPSLRLTTGHMAEQIFDIGTIALLLYILARLLKL